MRGLLSQLVVISLALCVSFSFTPSVRIPVPSRELDTRTTARRTVVFSSFYGDFEGESFGDNNDEDDDDDEEDDDDDYGLDDSDVADFRSRMSSMFDGGESTSSSSAAVDELISFATGTESVPEEWAEAADCVEPGTVLLANPSKFCSEFAGTVNRSLLSKFGLTLPPPADLGPDRRADLLPVLLVVEYEKSSGCRAVLLNRRTGYLLGDLEQRDTVGAEPAPLLEKFCIQPLWFGGVDNVSSGLEMLHLCPAVEGANRLTEDGLYWGGDPGEAQSAMEDPSLDRVMSGFDFKFFVQCTLFPRGEIEKSIEDQTFFSAKVSKTVLFKSRDRMGTQRAKPLWTEVMELLEGDFLEMKQRLYEEEDL